MAAALDANTIILRNCREQEEKVDKLYRLFKREDVNQGNLPYIIRQLVHLTIDDVFANVAKDLRIIDPRFEDQYELKKKVRNELTNSYINFCNTAFQV